MNRMPPMPVQRALRQEVSFGCPVNGCRKPFLTWHHFDPPWSVRHHHEQKGMIALCLEHHAHADSRAGFTADHLRALKKADYTTDTVKGNLPWVVKVPLLRLGGCYAGGTPDVLSVSGEPVIRVTAGPQGVLLLSFILKSSTGEVVAHMIDNGFQSDPSTLHDLHCNASQTRIKVWFDSRDIGLDLEFKRLTMDGLSAILQSDKERMESSPAYKRRMEGVNEGDFAARIPPWIAERLEPTREGHSTPDLVGSITKRWAAEHCLDADGKITLLDFDNISVYKAGRMLRVRDGIHWERGAWVYSAAFDCGGAFDL